MTSTPARTVLYVDADLERRAGVERGLADRLEGVAVRAVASLDPADGVPEECVAVVAHGEGMEAVASLERVGERYPSVLTVLLSDEEDRCRRASAAGVDEVVPGTGPAALFAVARRVETAATGAGDSAALPPDEHLRRLADSTEDAILTIDAESTVRYANPAVEDVFGYAPAEVVDESLTALMDEDAAARHRTGVERYLATGDRSLEWADVELVGRHRDGHAVPLSVSFAAYTVDEEQYFTGVVRDITKRKEVAEGLARHEAMVQMADDGIYALDEAGRFVAVDDAYADLVEHDRSALLGAAADRVVGEHTTERKRREERLAGLNEVAQRLTQVETREEVAAVVADAAAVTLGLPVATVDLYDDETGSLRTAARSDEAASLADDGALFAERGLPWRVYAEQEGRVHRSLTEDETAETPLRSVVALPIGGHGVLVAGATEADAVGETEATLAELLAANTEVAIERVDRKQELRARKRRAEERSEALERIERLNGVIRNITRSLTRVNSREEMEAAVCDNLGGEGPYAFCWIGERATVSGSELTARAAAGDGAGYLEETALALGEDPTDESPTATALRTGEPRARRPLDTDPPFEGWRAAAVERGFRSCAAVPLAHDETLYGVLTVYADRPGLFDDREVAVLAELGEMVGYAINAMEREKLLAADATVALRFELLDDDVPAVEFARETGGTFEFEELVRRSDGSFRVFFSVSGTDPDSVFEFVAATAGVRDPTLVSEDGDTARFEATADESGFLGRLVSAGAYPRAMAATADSAEVTVELPRSGDIQSFVRTFLDAHEATLVARVEHDRPPLTREGFGAVYRDLLTERQREVMQTAYHCGYFEWPRETSGQELAALLDVSQPTVTRHLRNGERKLLDLVFDDEERG